MHTANDNMRSVTAVVPQSADQCWRAITDAKLLPAWLPGVRRVDVINVGSDGLPHEVEFELVTSLSYSLLYSYDVAAREARWEPRFGKRDAVRGFVRCEPCEHGTQITYAVEQGAGRTASNAALGDPEAVLAAFCAWIAKTRQRDLAVTVP